MSTPSTSQLRISARPILNASVSQTSTVLASQVLADDSFEGSNLNLQEQVQKKLLGYNAVIEWLQNHKEASKYFGTIPLQFTQANPSVSPEALDELAKNLRKLEQETPLEEGVILNQSHVDSLFPKSLIKTLGRKKSPIETLFQNNEFKIKKLGAGVSGDVYQLSLNDESFAFKVFRPDRKGQKTQDVYREITVGSRLTKLGIRDISKLYAASTSNHPWTLMEYIGPDTKLDDRTGPTLKEMKIYVSDDNAKNRVNGILVDYGVVISLASVGFMAPDGFHKHLPEFRRQLKAQQEKKAARQDLSNSKKTSMPQLQGSAQNSRTIHTVALDLDNRQPLRALPLLGPTPSNQSTLSQWAEGTIRAIHQTGNSVQTPSGVPLSTTGPSYSQSLSDHRLSLLVNALDLSLSSIHGSHSRTSEEQVDLDPDASNVWLAKSYEPSPSGSGQQTPRMTLEDFMDNLPILPSMRLHEQGKNTQRRHRKGSGT